MSTSIFVSAATSNLGRDVVANLLPDVKSGAVKLTVSTRDASKVPKEWTQAGVAVKEIDYSHQADAWAVALQGTDRLLVVSSNTDLGPKRVAQHQHVIDGAAKADVKLLAYTSILNVDRHEAILAHDHRDTEVNLRASGVPYVILRNGWYVENWLNGKDAWKPTGVLASAAGNARFSAAPRADYAAAAAVVLRPSYAGPINTLYELGGPAFTLDEFAAEISTIIGTPVKHVSLPPQEYTQMLVTHAGLPEPYAALLVDADVQADKMAALYTDKTDLQALLGRPVGSYKDALRQALKA